MSNYLKQKIEDARKAGQQPGRPTAAPNPSSSGTATVWSYWRQPIEGDYRIREEIDGGRNHRIIGYVNTEEDAKRICDAINGVAGIETAGGNDRSNTEERCEQHR